MRRMIARFRAWRLGGSSCCAAPPRIEQLDRIRPSRKLAVCTLAPGHGGSHMDRTLGICWFIDQADRSPLAIGELPDASAENDDR